MAPAALQIGGRAVRCASTRRGQTVLSPCCAAPTVIGYCSRIDFTASRRDNFLVGGSVISQGPLYSMAATVWFRHAGDEITPSGESVVISSFRGVGSGSLVYPPGSGNEDAFFLAVVGAFLFHRADFQPFLYHPDQTNPPGVVYGRFFIQQDVEAAPFWPICIGHSPSQNAASGYTDVQADQCAASLTAMSWSQVARTPPAAGGLQFETEAQGSAVIDIRNNESGGPPDIVVPLVYPTPPPSGCGGPA